MSAIRTDDGNSRDHWVPQFYLRRWITGPEKKLSAFWRESGCERHSRCSPRAVLSENHLYSVYGVDGTFIHGESLIFKDIDHAAAPAFEYLANGNWRELSQQYIEPFYRFIYTLAPRSRHMRESFIQGDERMQSEVIGRLRNMGLPNADEEVHRFWSLFASPRDRAALQMLLIARFGDAWKRFFYDIPLCVYEIGDIDAEFFTSDAPLCSRPSIDAEDAIHVFPLSPKRCMVASQDPANVAKLCGAPLPIFVSVLNLGTLTRANTAIARDRRYEREIFKFLGASVNRTYCLKANEEIFQEKLRIGVGPEVKIIYGSESADEITVQNASRGFYSGDSRLCLAE